METTPNFADLARRARLMTNDELRYAVKDCREAAAMAFTLESRGHHVTKTQGYYTDEGYVFQAELLRREQAPRRSRP